jgi:ATP-dependent HslUV protease ATP-binding subunit HslU
MRAETENSDEYQSNDWFHFPKRKAKKIHVAQARKIFGERRITAVDNMDAIVEWIGAAEQDGFFFSMESIKSLEAIIKRLARFSRDGVQREILPLWKVAPLIRSSGPIKTDYILLSVPSIHTSKVSDLIPELQGRFPIMWKLDSLSETDFWFFYAASERVHQAIPRIDRNGKVELRFNRMLWFSLQKWRFLKMNKRESRARRLYT